MACRSWTCDLGLDDVVAKLVGLAVDDARLDAAAGHPEREAVRVVVAAEEGRAAASLRSSACGRTRRPR